MRKEPAKLPLTMTMPQTSGIVAAQAEFFGCEGFDLTRKVLANSDIPRAALASDQVEVVTISIDSLVRAHAAGFDRKLLQDAECNY